MPFGSSRRAGLPTFYCTISADNSNQTLRALANTAGYPGYGHCQITLASTYTLGATSTGNAACTPGSWPAGVTVTLVISSGAFISGAGGAGGNALAGAGGAGGTALDASGVSGFTFKVDNQGTIRGGGGGGGAGNRGSGDWLYGGAGPDQTMGGGGGGGGQGWTGGAAGAGDYGADFPGNAGTVGGPTGAGSGGSPGQTPSWGGYGGNGGTWGNAGSAASAIYASGGSNAGGAGGAGGKAVNGNSNITWINTGTRTGTVA